MAFSKITIEFTAIPNLNDVLSIQDASQEYYLNQTFKNLRTGFAETKRPAGTLDLYRMTVAAGVEIDNIGAEYTPLSGVSTRTPLTGLPADDNPDGGYSYKVCSSTAVVLYDVTTLESISWPYGEFSNVGFCANSYTEFISENYWSAFNADYNVESLFTTSYTIGEAGTGLGTVVIIANYPDAVFTSPTYPFANITIENQVNNSVDPDVLSFEGDVFSTIIPKQINITTSDNWTVTNDLPAWLSISSMLGEGNATLNVVPQNFSEMAVGTYNHTIKITIGLSVFNVSVSFALSDNIETPFEEGKLYFTKELIYLYFNSLNENTYIELSIDVSIFSINTDQETIYNRIYKLPMFKGKAEFHVGTIVHELLEEINTLKDFVPNFKSNYYKAQFRPAEVTISFIEKSYQNPDLSYLSGSFPMFKMTKGYRPFTTESQLSLISSAQQDVIRISPNTPITVSFICFGSPRIIVKRNAQVIDDFEIVENSLKMIYTYFRFVQNLRVGDSLEVMVVSELETRTQRFQVFPNGKEITFFLFENSFGIIDSFEFTGRRRINSTMQHVVAPKFKNLYSFDKKVDSKNVQPMICNTGIMAKNEHRVIYELIKSTNVWCSMNEYDSQYLKVDATTTKMPNQDTDTNEEGFDVEFNILENADASIYPR